jgi:hypothetical protein
MTDFTRTEDHVRQFIKAIGKLEHDKALYDIFRDFCEMSYCALAKMTAAGERADQLEARYMQIVGSYRDKDTIRAFPELLAIAANAIEGGGCDFLGSVASQMSVLNSRLGQFFTPYELSRMMAELTLQEIGPVIAANGYLTIAEPASGAGGMVLAAADVLERSGFDPSFQMLVNAVDISPMCFHMTYVQASLRGIPALVELGDTLRNTRTEKAWTIATLDFYGRHGKLFATAEPATQQPEEPGLTLPESAPIADVTLQLDLFAQR